MRRREVFIRTASDSLKPGKAPDFSPPPAARPLCRSLRSGFIAQFERFIRNPYQSDAVGKVLVPMQKPPGYAAARVEPLLCVWWIVGTEGSDEAWFTLPVQGAAFPEIHVFSLTRYLLGLPDDLLELELPALSARLNWLERIFPL